MVNLQTSLDVVFLLLAEPCGLLGERGEEEEEGEGYNSRKGTLDDEDPPPSRVASVTIHLPDCGCQETAKAARESGAAKEEGVPALSFGALVPHANQIKAAREHARLEHAQEESSCEETGIVLDQTLTDHDHAKQEHAPGKPDPGTESLEEDVGGDLADDVWNEEHGEGGIVFYILQFQVLDQAEGARIANIDSVEEGEEVENTEEGNHSEIDLRHELPLGRVRWAFDVLPAELDMGAIVRGAGLVLKTSFIVDRNRRRHGLILVWDGVRRRSSRVCLSI